MLRCEGLVLRAGEFTLSADIAVGPGIVAVIGPSGAGKSTFLSALAGFLRPVEGRISWDGKDFTEASPGDRPISILFQDNNLFPHLTVAQNIGLALGPRLRLSPTDRNRVEAALEATGLSGLGARRPADLSGGQQSRAALARTLLSDRPIVLLDEPFAALGPALKDEMLDRVAATLGTPGRLILMVTHDPDDARRIAPRTLVVADGAVTGPYNTAPLLDDPPRPLKAYLGPG
jgi:thiamine transport system ATP-binding protein